jgi:hypothetical protein
MQPAKPRIPAWLIIVYILSLLTILGWPLMAFMSVFAFDAPGSAQDPRVWTGVTLLLAYPVLPLVGVIGSFFTYRARHARAAYLLVAMGAIPLVIAAVALAAIFVTSVLAVIRPGF